MHKGTVYLVGAGPGDYRLITLKGLEYLREADAIVHDRLADSRLLGFTKAEAEFFYVGKESSHHTMRQEEINALLVELARAGKAVVRLKGGDSFVFGRGGEEALYLKKHGIPFEVVPGVTSAIAVPAYAGIPVTHRGVATSFAVVTGHEDPAKGDSGINWPHLATGADTLVFLMGMENLPEIARQLLTHGRHPATPVALIRWGTKPEQQVLTGELEKIVTLAAEQNFQPPAIIIVGEVVRLSAQLSWFDTKPLFGKRVMVTRTREQAGTFVRLLEEYGAQCIECPTIRIIPPASFQPLDEAIHHLPRYHWVIFTSANGVEHFWQRLQALGKDSRALAAAKVCAIGVATAQALMARGIVADFVPDEYRAEGLIAGLARTPLAGANILLPRAETAREILPEELNRLGARVDVVPAYRTVPAREDGAAVARMLRDKAVDVITFTSSSTVQNFVAMLEGQNLRELLADAVIACIGPVTRQTALELNLPVHITAEEYTIPGLTRAIIRYYAGNKE